MLKIINQLLDNDCSHHLLQNRNSKDI